MNVPMNELIILEIVISLVGSGAFFSFHGEMTEGVSRRTNRAIIYITLFVLNSNLGGLILENFIVELYLY